MMLWLKKLKYRFSNERQMNLALKQISCNVMMHRTGAFVAGFIPSEGICANLAVQRQYTANRAKVLGLMAQWPDLYDRRELAYPVGGILEYYREQTGGTIWQNPRRVQLLQWMIEQTEFKP